MARLVLCERTENPGAQIRGKSTGPRRFWAFLSTARSRIWLPPSVWADQGLRLTISGRIYNSIEAGSEDPFLNVPMLDMHLSVRCVTKRDLQMPHCLICPSWFRVDLSCRSVCNRFWSFFEAISWTWFVIKSRAATAVDFFIPRSANRFSGSHLEREFGDFFNWPIFMDLLQSKIWSRIHNGLKLR